MDKVLRFRFRTVFSVLDSSGIQVLELVYRAFCGLYSLHSLQIRVQTSRLHKRRVAVSLLLNGTALQPSVICLLRRDPA